MVTLLWLILNIQQLPIHFIYEMACILQPPLDKAQAVLFFTNQNPKRINVGTLVFMESWTGWIELSFTLILMRHDTVTHCYSEPCTVILCAASVRDIFQQSQSWYSPIWTHFCTSTYSTQYSGVSWKIQWLICIELPSAHISKKSSNWWKLR